MIYVQTKLHSLLVHKDFRREILPSSDELLAKATNARVQALLIILIAIFGALLGFTVAHIRQQVITRSDIVSQYYYNGNNGVQLQNAIGGKVIQ